MSLSQALNQFAQNLGRYPQSMQQHYSSKPIEQNSKSRLAQPQDGFDDNGEAVLAYFLEAFTASTAFCSD